MQRKLLFNAQHSHVIMQLYQPAHGYGKVGRAMASSLVRSTLSNILIDYTF